jgi:hypothetical protein
MFPEDFYKCVKTGLIEVELIGNGSYNKVFLTKFEITIDGFSARWIAKMPLSDEEHARILQTNNSSSSSSSSSLIFEKLNEKIDNQSVNSPERAERKWAMINQDIPVHVFWDEAGDALGWMTPYLGCEIPNDDLINSAVIDIYQRTGNIIVDACITSNFIKYQGKAICIDMDLAIHRESLSSSTYFNSTIASSIFDNFFACSQVYGNFKTQSTIKTLLYLEDKLATSKIDYHLINHWMVDKLHIFRRGCFSIHANTLKVLNYLREHQFAEEYFNPMYVNQLVKTWSEEMPLEAVQQKLLEIKSFYTFNHTQQLSFFRFFPIITVPSSLSGMGFFTSLTKRLIPEATRGPSSEPETFDTSAATLTSEMKV